MGSIYQLTLLLSLFGSLLLVDIVEAAKTKRHHGKKGREELSQKAVILLHKQYVKNTIKVSERLTASV